MGHKMKYTKGGFPFKSSPAKVDLTKKSGFGPKAAKGSDDQSKELAKSKYEMGEYKIDPTAQPTPKNKPVKPKSGDMKKYSDLEKYDDDR